MNNYLYIHIPFCVKKCLYCDFFSVPFDQVRAKAYINALCKELILKAEDSASLKTVYIGGGTPTVLPEGGVRQLFESLKDSFDFSPVMEITVEANPGTVNESKIHALTDSGVNRFSIGIQSFNDIELGFLGRIHNSEEAIITVEALIKNRVDNFSIDLMYGIPGQTMDSWRTSLRNAVELSPTHISTYELTLEENTPLYKLIREYSSDTPIRPDEELILDMYNYTIDYLAEHGFEHYEISNFAKPGFKCLHNLNYWDRGEYIGAGAGAHSFINGTRKANVTDVDKYIESINSGIIPETGSTVITPSESLKEFIFLGLRKTQGISIKNLSMLSMSNEGVSDNLLDSSKELIAKGYLELKGDCLRLTRKGIVISNTIIVKLFEKLGR